MFLTILALGIPFPASGALQRGFTSYAIDTVFQVESAIGQIPGHWSLNGKGFREQFQPDPGFGNGIFSVPMDAPATLGFDLDSIGCVPCALLKQREHQLEHDSKRRNAYQCKPGLQGSQAFFMVAVESVMAAEDPVWVESEGPSPRYPMSGSPGKDHFFHEWITTREVVPGKRLACGAWIQGAYPPKGEYSEEYGDTIANETYVIRDRGIYLVGRGNDLEFLYRSAQPVRSGKITFESAFLPPHHSDLENIGFSYVYRIRGGFWLRINFSRSVEGAGADEGMFILQFRNGMQLLAGNTAIRMY